MTCPLCEGGRPHYSFSFKGNRVQKCPDCSLLFLHPQPSDQALSDIYTKDYFLGQESEESRTAVADMKKATAGLYLKDLLAYHGPARGRLLELGCGRGEFLEAAKEAGFQVTGTDLSQDACDAANARLGAGTALCGDLGKLQLPAAGFDACVLFDMIEHSRDPVALLKKARLLLKPGGTLFIVTPSLDTFSARLLKRNWMEFKTEHLFYFDTQTLQLALAKSGFEKVECLPNTKVLTLDYLHRHFERFKVPLFTRLIALLHAVFPKWVKTRPIKTASSGVNVLARMGELREKPRLSIIVPVYNEKATFGKLMEALLAKELPDWEKEIILVESNSKDGTREEALKFRGRPGIKVLLEERPQGKGHAVRTGLKEASGDVVMIQDGDLEYDINDYDELLEPLRLHQRLVVLGSRHSGSWKIREFTGQPLVSMILNGAHFFFALLLNLACGSRLRDPFTMFKLFRRDCVHGLAFKANRFDFDWELMIKLLRKGYQPLEIPVNYRSRSFQEGKKVSFFRDPLTWLWALVRFRLAPLYEKK